jgi:hypothetical protein
VIEVPAQAEVYRPWPTFWRVSDAIARLRQLLDALPDGSPLIVFLPKVDGTEPDRVLRSRVAVSSTLVAGLERARAESGGALEPIQVLHRDDHRAVQVAFGPLAWTVSGAITALGRSISYGWPRGMWRGAGQGRGPGRSICSRQAR